jgi:serine/threonine protein kinase
LLRSHQNAGAGGGDGPSFPSSSASSAPSSPSAPPLLIPSRDGSILLGLGGPGEGLQQLPYRAQELVAHLPFVAGSHVLVGSQSSRVLEVALSTGRVLRDVSGAGGVCPTEDDEEPGKEEGQGKSSAGPTLWLGRTDYVVRAYDTSQRRELWNVSYGEASPPHAALLDGYTRAAEKGFFKPPAGSPGGPGGSAPAARLSAALASRLSLTATMQGQVVAADAATGALVWHGPDLRVPVSAVFAVGLDPDGSVVQSSVPFVEVWPHTAPAWARRMEVEGGGGGDGGGGSGDEEEAQPDSPLASRSPTSQVFIGMLDDGQLYAAPAGRRTVVLPPGADASLALSSSSPAPLLSSEQALAIESSGQVLFLPAPSGAPRSAATQDDAGGLDLIAGGPPSDPIGALVEQELLEQCALYTAPDGGAGGAGSRAASRRRPPLPQCIVGLHNVSFVVDPDVHRRLPLSARQWIDAGRNILGPPSLPGATSPTASSSSSSSLSGGVVVDGSVVITEVIPPTQAPQPSGAVGIAAKGLWIASVWIVGVVFGGEGSSPAPDGAVDAVYATLLATAGALFAGLVIGLAYQRGLGSRGGGRKRGKRGAKSTAAAGDDDGSAPLPQPSESAHATQSELSETPLSQPLSLPPPRTVDGVEYRAVSRRLAISDRALGYGSHGTVVFAGQWDSRAVAVKRMLRAFHPAALREASLLVKTDGHPNVVRYFSCEEGPDFLYLALELCDGSLANAVEACARARAKAARQLALRGSMKGAAATPTTKGKGGKQKGAARNRTSLLLLSADADEMRPGLSADDGGAGDVDASDDDGVPPLPVPAPTPATRAFLHGIVAGIAHLHAHRIVHRDIKPHNILLARKGQGPAATTTTTTAAGAGAGTSSSSTSSSSAATPNPDADVAHLYPDDEHHTLGAASLPKISDFGLSKQLDAESSSFGAALPHAARAAGSSSCFLPATLYRGDGALSSHSTSAVAPGSVGWQAPEIIVPVLRARVGAAGRSALAPVEEGDGDRRGAEASDAAEPTAASSSSSSSSSLGGAADSSSSSSSSSGSSTTPDDALWRKSRASDIWSLGCVLFTVLDAGAHPFGPPFERESNILRGREPDLARLAPLPLAASLLRPMLARDPAARPSAARVLEHPFFWSDAAALAFLCDLSDRIEGAEEKGGPKTSLLTADEALAAADLPSPLAAALSGATAAVVGPGGWSRRLPQALIGDLPTASASSSASSSARHHKRYDYSSLSDCLRLLRNRKNHYRELPLAVRRDILGSESPVALVPFFHSRERFPLLLAACHDFACTYLAHERPFAAHLGPATAAAHAKASAAALARLLQKQAAEASAAAATAAAAAAAAAGDPRSPLSSKARPPPPKGAAHAAPAAAPAAASRTWFGTESGWLAAAAAVSHRAATRTGGPVLAASDAEADGDGGPGRADGAGAGPGPGPVMVVSAHERVLETRFKGGAHASDPRYKSRLCKEWEAARGAFCPRGARCDFAHGPLELRGRGTFLGLAGVEVRSGAAGGGEAGLQALLDSLGGGV